MVGIILVGFLPNNHSCSCEVHPYGCGNALIDSDGNGEGRLVRLHLVAGTHLAGYAVRRLRHTCFAACEYATCESAQVLHGSLLGIMEVFLPDSDNRSMRALYHCNRGYAYADVVK